MGDFRSLSRLYAYNAWANARVFATCLGLDQAQMEAAAPGTYGTLTDTLKHMIGVEHTYALMLRDLPRDDGATREAFYARDVAWFAVHAVQLGDIYQQLIAAADDAFLEAPLSVPWFDFALTKHDGLLQVATHSAQHRAQVFSTLGQQSIEVPDLDFVQLVHEQQMARQGGLT